MTGVHNPLFNPGVFGLELMAELDIGIADGFDVVCVWRHAITGQWYISADVGAADREPFDCVQRDDFTAVFTIDGVAEYARGWWDDVPEDGRERAVETLTTLVRDAWRKAGTQ